MSPLRRRRPVRGEDGAAPARGGDRLREILDRAGQDELLQIRDDVMTVYRRVVRDGEEMFPLRYSRSGVRHALPGLPPVLVIPGGPGTASVLPYEGLRRSLAARGLESVMVEHRGVGLSRLDAEGEDLPARAMRLREVLDDLVAVLDHARIEQAVVLGSAYGAYLAQALAALHPERVHSLVLDSPLTSADDELESQRALRARYWDGSDERAESVARVLRRLVADEVIDGRRAGPVIARVHDFGGTPAVHDLVDLLALDRGHLTWRSVRQTLTQQWLQSAPYVYEHDLVAPIAHTELGLGSHADGGPMDALQLAAEQARAVAPFAGEPVDLHALSRRITAPTVVLSGGEDLVVPTRIAEQLAQRIPRSSLVVLPGVGHSVLDTHSQVAAIVARWAAAGAGHLLPERAAELAALRRTPSNWALMAGIRTALAAERLSPWRLWVESARTRRAEATVDPMGRRARRGMQ